jgi:hypothetical protein
VRRVQSLPVRADQPQPYYDRRPPSAPLPTTSSPDAMSKKRPRFWQGPPEALHGPEDHQFFSTISRTSSSEYRPRVDSKTEEGIACSISTAYAYTGLPVYPYLPPPTLSFDSTVTSPNRTTAEVATSRENVIPEEPEPTASAEKPSSDDFLPPVCSQTTATAAAADQPDVQPSAHMTDPLCTLQYVRAVPTDPPNGYALIHGQVWRSGDRKTGWRRNQWVIDGG